jgi:hypothetical protein
VAAEWPLVNCAAELAASVAYTEATGRDVYVWWEELEWKEPDDGWRCSRISQASSKQHSRSRQASKYI